MTTDCTDCTGGFADHDSDCPRAARRVTTRAQLESEREALRGVLAYVRRQDASIGSTDSTTVDALTASIARVEALLSLSDEDAQWIALCLRTAALRRDEGSRAAERTASVLAVADLIRREPRGDV